MEALLLGRMGLQPLVATGEAVQFVPSDATAGYLVAELQTPKGRVRIGGGGGAGG